MFDNIESITVCVSESLIDGMCVSTVLYEHIQSLMLDDIGDVNLLLFFKGMSTQTKSF